MSVREEDRQRNSRPGRGLGLAAAAIGRYFSSNPPGNPGREGSTGGWTYEEPHAFNASHGDADTTVSEDSTFYTSRTNSTDTADETDSSSETESSRESRINRVVERDQSSERDTTHVSISSDDSECENNTIIDTTHVSISSDDSSDIIYLPSVVTVFNVSSDSDTMDSDVTSSSNDVPRHEGNSPTSPLNSLLNNFGASVSSSPGIRRQAAEENQMASRRHRSLYEKEQLRMLREQFCKVVVWVLTLTACYLVAVAYIQSSLSLFLSLASNPSGDIPPGDELCRDAADWLAIKDHMWFLLATLSLGRKLDKFRERSYTLEECSICCDIILNDQQVTTLPCTHNFHSGCITPWLQEQQTCPNCREAAE